MNPGSSTPPGPFVCLQPLILASGSPRRQAFLRDLGITFSVEVPDTDETPAAGEAPEAFALRAAADKAGAVAGKHPDHWVLAADTIVVLGERILGKPRDEDHARKMLLLLSGRTHRVITGFCLQRGDRPASQRAVCTEVEFGAFSEEIAAAYVATGEPLDKAGSYGIQGRGGFLVESIRGSYTNVVGLPMAETVGELLRFGVIACGP